LATKVKEKLYKVFAQEFDIFMPKLVVTNTEFKDREFELKDESISIGRLEDNQIELPESSLSSHHALFNRHESGNFILKDNSSTNGTYLNGDKLLSEKLLKNGDKMRFGQMLCDYVSEIPSPATEEPSKVQDTAQNKKTNKSDSDSPKAPQDTQSTVSPSHTASPPASTFKGLKKEKSPMTVINIVLIFIAGLFVAVTLARLMGIL